MEYSRGERKAVHDKISTSTLETAAVIKELLSLHSFDPGPAQAKLSNGDCIWFTLTTDEEFTAVLILLIADTEVLTEYTLGDGIHHMGAVTNVGNFVRWLRTIHFRALTPSEFAQWTGGQSPDDSADEDFPPTTWDESG